MDKSQIGYRLRAIRQSAEGQSIDASVWEAFREWLVCQPLTRRWADWQEAFAEFKSK